MQINPPASHRRVARLRITVHAASLVGPADAYESRIIMRRAREHP